MKASEESSVVANPVKCRRTEDGIGQTRNWQVRCIRADQLNATAESRPQKLSCDLQHVRGQVDGDDTAAWQTLEQFLGEAPRPAADIEHELVSGKREPFENFPSPFELRRGHLMV
jgi:hypothetical protein